ncbi:MAG: hypothetical protein ABI665_00620 [Vicinamibacterales bacterium]
MRSLALGITIGLLVTATPIRGAAALEVAGAWTLNRDLTAMPEPGTERGPGRRPERGGGRMGGRGGFGGFGGGNGPNEADLHKTEVVRRRMTEIPDRLIIVRDGTTVSITDGNGRHLSFKADGKKQQQVTGDGEFKTKTIFEGANLVIEEDFGGPKVTTTYTPVLDGGEIRRLEVTLKVEGDRSGGHRGPGGPGGPPSLKRVYDSESR